MALTIFFPKLSQLIITNPSDIANAFNNYFAKIAIVVKSSLRIPKKKYFYYLKS